MIILGIDPGLAIVGYGILEYHGNQFYPIAMGSIETPAGIDVEERLNMIYGDMCELIKTYRPDEMAIEELFFNTNQKTAIAVAEARGVILLSAIHHGVKISEYTPLQVKQSVVGYGRAEKHQVITMVKTLLHLGDSLKLDDTADALAIAICHAHACGSLMQSYYNEKKKKLL